MFDIEKMWENIAAAKRICIIGHIRPDGDCIGSCLSFYNYVIEQFECEADVYIEAVPEEFKFLKGSETVNTLFPDVPDYDVAVVLDCGDLDRVGKGVKYLRKATISYCIDHHATNQGFAMENLINPKAAACCEILYDVFDKEKLSKASAQALYLGIVHDTGVFKHSTTTADTMRIAGELLNYGVSSTQIIDGTFYEKTYLQNQILGRCLMESILCMDGRVIFSTVDRKVQALYNLVPSDTDGVIDQLRVTKGVEVAILLKEMNPRVWRVTMRSKEKVNVALICQQFGGGGHVRAAGCIITGSMHDVINALTAHIEKQIG